MAKATFTQTKFNAGIYTAELDGHIDAPRRANSVSDSQNLIPTIQGELHRRSGTMFVKEVKDSSGQTALVDFEYNVEQSYILEFGDQYIRVYRNNAALVEASKNITAVTNADPCVVTISSHGYSNGDEVYIESVGGTTELNGSFYLVSNVTTNTFELQDTDGNDIDSTAFGVYTSGGTAAKTVEISTPYTQADLFDSDGIFQIKYVQSNDALYLVHPSYKPRALTRTSSTAFNLTTLTFNDGPYLATNTTTTTLARSGTTVTASSVTGINGGSGFQTTDVGRMIRMKNGSNWEAMTITARTSTTQVTVDNSGTISANINWRLGVYSDTDGWPQAVCFFEDRIGFGGSGVAPNRIDLSETGGFSPTSVDFAPSDLTGGTVTASSAIQAPLNSGNANIVRWMSPDEKGVAIGTSGGEWWLRASSNGEALTADNAKATRSSTRGSSNMAPVAAGNATLFVQRLRERIFEYAYVFEADGFRSPDMSVFAPIITTGGIIDMAYQEIPYNTLWLVRSDGVLLGFVYDRTQDATAWHKHVIGGSFGSGAAVVEAVKVIPGNGTNKEEAWLIVKRTINGTTRRYVEYITRPYDNNTMAQDEAFFVDSGLTYDGSATSSISGLSHLEGESVAVLVDGKAHPNLTVTSGAVTLANDVEGEVVHIGLPNTWYLVGQGIEAGARDGTAQTKIKRITNFAARVRNTLGLKYGPSLTVLDEYPFDYGTDFDEPDDLFTGETDTIAWPDGYDRDVKVVMSHDGAFPATIQSYTVQLVTQDR